MPTRYADLKFRVTGGDKLQREIQAINAELKKLKAQTSEAKAQFAGMENTEEALRKKTEILRQENKKLNELLNEQKTYLKGAQGELARVTAEYQQNEKAIQATERQIEIATKKWGAESQQVELLKRHLNELTSKRNVLEKAQTQGNKTISDTERKIANVNEALAKNGTELSKHEKYLQEAENSWDHCAKSINQWGEELEGASESAQLLASAIMMSGAKAAVDALTESIKECIGASAEFDQALTGVAKTTSLSGENLDQFGERLKDLATKIPLSTTELAKIAEVAGQLGIKEKDLLAFTETMAALTVSTNIAGEEGAENLARFMNIMGTSQDQVDRLGASIVDLGNNFATTEAEILAMAMNLAGAGKQLNLSEADILGIATAISSVGIAAGKGGTAFSKMLINMAVAVSTNSDKLEDFARIAGKTTEEFTELFNSNRMKAIDLFFKGLGNGSESAIEKLTEMGVTEVRLRDTMLRLANSNSLLTDAVEMSNTAFKENTALVREANLFYGTTESQTKLLENAINNLKIAVGDALNPALNQFKGYATDAIKKITEWVKNNQPLVKTLVVLTTTIGTLIGSYVTLTTAATALKTIQATLNLTMAANPYLAVAGALAALVAVIATCILSMDSMSNRTKEINENFNSIIDTANRTTDAYKNEVDVITATASVASDYIDILRSLDEQTELTKNEQTLYNQTVEKLQNLFPNLNIEIDETTGKLKGGTEALWEQIEAWEENAAAAAKAAYIQEMTTELTNAQIELRKTEIELDNIRKKLTQATSERMEVEALLLGMIGSQSESLEILDQDERIRLEDLLNTDAAAKQLYDQYNDLKNAEIELMKEEEAHEKALKIQQDGLEDLQEELEITEQAVNDLGTEFSSQSDKISSSRDSFKTAAMYAVDGAIAGVRAKEDEYATAWKNVARAGARAYMNEDKIASPSKVYRELAQFDVEGLIEGTKDQKQRLEDAYTNLALRGQTAYTNASQTINNNSASTVNLYVQELSDDQLDRITKVVNRRLSYV